MKKTISILILMFACTAYISSPLAYSEEMAQNSPATGQTEINAAEEVGPTVKKMKGRVKSMDVSKNSFVLIPDNVGEGIDILCESSSTACKVTVLSSGQNAEAEVYYDQERWYAKSVKSISSLI